MSNENERKQKLITEAIKRQGAGLTLRPGYSISEQHREFLETKKGTHGDYNFSPDDEAERVRGNNEIEKLHSERKLSQNDEAKDTQTLLSERVEQELKKNSLISVTGKVENKYKTLWDLPRQGRLFSNSHLKIGPGRSMFETGDLSSDIDIFCGLNQPSYAPGKLNSAIENLTSIKPSGLNRFILKSDGLQLGESLYKEHLGQIIRKKTESTTIEPQAKHKMTRAGVDCEALESQSTSTQEVYRTTTVHLYPDIFSAQFIYQYLTDPGVIHSRLVKDCLAADDKVTRSYFESLALYISNSQLTKINIGNNIKDIFYSELLLKQKEAWIKYNKELEDRRERKEMLRKWSSLDEDEDEEW